MMKKMLCFAITMMLILAGVTAGMGESTPAPTEGGNPEPLTAKELAEWADGIKARALELGPDNDPTDESAETEDGIVFAYPFATLYADKAEMNGETRINAITMSDEGENMPRKLNLSMTPGEASALFPTDNPQMAGDRTGAILYIRSTGEDSTAYGRVYRDGQRVQAIEYGEIVPDQKGYRIAVLSCLFTDGILYEIRAAGFTENPDAQISKEDRDLMIEEMKALDLKDEYAAVKSSRNGTDLTPFGPEDLVFSGINFLTVKPEELPEPYVQDMFDNEDGTWILTVTGEEYEAVFQCDKDGKNAKIVSFTVNGEELEGPRGVRLGDLFHEDMQRFRFEGRGMDENGGEVLYGEADQVPRGTVSYAGDDGITVQYVTDIGDGKNVTLLMRYTFNLLSEIMILVGE